MLTFAAEISALATAIEAEQQRSSLLGDDANRVGSRKRTALMNQRCAKKIENFLRTIPPGRRGATAEQIRVAIGEETKQYVANVLVTMRTRGLCVSKSHRNEPRALRWSIAR